MFGDSTPRIGLLGFGQVGRAFAAGLSEAGAPFIVAFDSALQTPESAALLIATADEIGIRLAHDAAEVAEKSDVLLSVVPGFASRDAFESVSRGAAHLRCYADLTTSTPSTKAAIGDAARDLAIPFVDGAILGPVSKFRHRVPILAAGSGSATFGALMGPYGMDIRVIPGHAGDATSIKLLRSVFMKGLGALLWETVLAARRAGVLEFVLKSIIETIDSEPFSDLHARFLSETAFHARRRIEEATSSMEMLERIGIAPFMTRATIARLEQLAALEVPSKFQGQVPSDFGSILELIEQA